MERIVRGRTATLTKTFTFTPTGTPTVTLTRVSDGTTVATGGVTGAGTTWSYTIPSTSNTLVDNYVETWTAVTGGAAQTFTDYIEVAGGVLFTVADARANPALANTTTYPDSAIIEMRTTVEQAIEQACGCAFVPRYFEETFNGEGGLAVFTYAPLVGNVPNTTIPFVTQVRSAAIAGVAVTAADVLPDVAGFYYATTWPTGYRNILIRYTTGAQSVPAEISQAALLLAKMWLVGARNPIDDRAVTFSTTDGGTYSLAVPGRNGSVFGQPDIDSVIQRYSMAVGVA